MLIPVACPHCFILRDRDTNEYRELRPCPDCHALVQLCAGANPHLVLVCAHCWHVFEGADGQTRVYPSAPRCPKCGMEPGRPLSATPLAVWA